MFYNFIKLRLFS